MLDEIIQTVKIIEKIDGSHLKPKTKVNHMNTKTTKQIMQISDSAEKQLSIIGKDIIRLLDRNMPLSKIRERLKVKVGTIIANTVRESYLTGFHFIESFEQRTVKLTVQHIDIINKDVEMQIESFWKSISKIVSAKKKEQNKTTIVGAAGFFDSLGNLFTGLATSLAVSMSFLSLNKATITTQKQVFNERVIDKSSTANLHDKSKVIWITERDSTVCPICRPLDGREWFVNDSSILVPGKDTHPRCRCRMLPVSKGKVFNA